METFQKSADQLDKSLFDQHKLGYKVGIWVDSVVLKFQKRSWLNNTPAAKPFEESVFCSIWLGKGRLNYNIHALKLRELTAWSIKSREFAEAFRAKFKPFEEKWPNVSVNFGPLTLMQGWVAFDEENLENIITTLSYQFLEIVFIIDDLLHERKK